MSHTNKITKSILEMIGDPKDGGYYLDDVPVYLNKDKTTSYPEIRVSPFIQKRDVDIERYIEPSYTKYRRYEAGTTQIDIYTRNVIEGQNIYDKLINRLYDFFNLETVIYNWNPNFQETENGIYKNIDYALTGELFKDIYSVKIGKDTLKKVFNYEDIVDDSWYVDNEALYVKTNKQLKNLNIEVILQGQLFKNGDAYPDRGLHFHQIVDPKNLSALEDNDVERVSFDLFILYSHVKTRENIPDIKGIQFPVRDQVR